MYVSYEKKGQRVKAREIEILCRSFFIRSLSGQNGDNQKHSTSFIRI